MGLPAPGPTATTRGMNVLFSLAVIGALTQPPAPALHAAEPLAALGPVKAGPPVRHTFDLTHRWAAGTLTITGVEAGCGCLRQHLTVGTLARMVLALVVTLIAADVLLRVAVIAYRSVLGAVDTQRRRRNPGSPRS